MTFTATAHANQFFRKGWGVLSVSVILVWLFGCAYPSAGHRASSAGATPGTASANAQPTETPSAENPKVELDPGVRGRVRSVHATLRYAVMDFSLWRMPRIDQRLGVFREGRKVGEIKVTGPFIETTAAGDILSGETRVGDEVREE